MKIKIYIFGLIAIFAIVVAIDYFEEKPIDWYPYYSTAKKEPLGLYVLQQELPDLMHNSVTEFSDSPYEYLQAAEFVGDTLNKETFMHFAEDDDIDRESMRALFKFAARGNSVFLSMGNYPNKLLDTLDLQSHYLQSLTDTVSQKVASDGKMHSYKFYDGIGYFSVNIGKRLEHEVLGFQADKDSVKPNFVRTPWGKGEIFVHTQPAVFSNYHLLKDDHRKLAEQILSHLPSQKILFYNKSIIQYNATPLRYVLSQTALKYAWFTFLLGAIVFMIFRAKRMQRVVPIIEPLTNTTVDFTKTVANLYLRENDHGPIIDKKIIHFLAKVRSDLMLDTEKLDENFIKKLQQKSGKDYFTIERAVFLIKMHQQNKIGATEKDLIQLNKALENIL